MHTNIECFHQIKKVRIKRQYVRAKSIIITEKEDRHMNMMDIIWYE